MNDRVTAVLGEILSEVFLEKVDLTKDITLAERFSADRFDMIEIMVALEERLGIDIPDEDINNFYRTGSAIEYLGNRLKEIDEWIKRTN